MTRAAGALTLVALAALVDPLVGACLAAVLAARAVMDADT